VFLRSFRLSKLQKRIEVMQREDRDKSIKQTILTERIAELERENTEMKELVLKLRDIAMLAAQSGSTGQGSSQTPLPTLDWMSGLMGLNNQDLTSGSGIGDTLQYTVDQLSNSVNGTGMVAPDLSATSWSNENPTPTFSSSSHATLTPGVEGSSTDPQRSNELLGQAVARSFTLAQAAEIIKGTFGDTNWEEDLATWPGQSGGAEMDVFSAVPACWTNQELPSTTEVDIKSTFDVVRLLETHQFDFDNDLGCPIFQAMVMISIGHGHVTVPVRAEDGNVISSDQLWARLVGRFKVSPQETCKHVDCISRV
jgi:hypothetical protein